MQQESSQAKRTTKWNLYNAKNFTGKGTDQPFHYELLIFDFVFRICISLYHIYVNHGNMDLHELLLEERKVCPPLNYF